MLNISASSGIQHLTEKQNYYDWQITKTKVNRVIKCAKCYPSRKHENSKDPDDNYTL